MGLPLWTIDEDWEDNDVPTLEEERMAEADDKLINEDGTLTLEEIEYTQHKIQHTDKGRVRSACQHCKDEALYGTE